MFSSSWFTLFFRFSLPTTDKVQNVRIDLDNKKVFVTSSELNADQLLEAIKKTGKTTNYIGLANWRIHIFFFNFNVQIKNLWFNEMLWNAIVWRCLYSACIEHTIIYIFYMMINRTQKLHEFKIQFNIYFFWIKFNLNSNQWLYLFLCLPNCWLRHFTFSLIYAFWKQRFDFATNSFKFNASWLMKVIQIEFGERKIAWYRAKEKNCDN